MTFALEQDRPKRSTVLIVGVVGLAVLVAVFVGVVALRSESQQSDVPGRAGEPPAAAVPRPEERLTAENVKWREFAGAAVPASSAGPRLEQGGRALGFDRSPAGAVLAASNLIYRASSGGGPEVYRTTIAEQVVGADKEKLLSNIEAEYKDEKANGAPDPLSPQGIARTRALKSGVWAYRLDLYGEDAATVNVLLRSVPAGGPNYVNLALSVKWINDDWRLVAPLNGQWPSVSRTVPAVPEGYTVLGRA